MGVICATFKVREITYWFTSHSEVMVKIGLICMQNKATAKPMVEILKRLTSDLDIEV